MGLDIVEKLDSMMTATPVSTPIPHPGVYCPGSTCSLPSPDPYAPIGITRAPTQPNMDCILILDNSGSIGKAEFDQAKKAAKVRTFCKIYQITVDMHLISQ